MNIYNHVCMYICVEMKIRQEKGLLSKNAILLAIDDPKPNIGSGSATLNALLCVAEYLAAREGRTVRRNSRHVWSHDLSMYIAFLCDAGDQ